MRTKIWHQMIGARYKAIYLSYFNSYIRSLDRWLEGLLVVASSGAIAGWLLWQHLPWLWAAIIGAAQLIKVLKPHLPWLKEREQLAASYVFYQQQHYHFECLWEALEAETEAEEATRTRYLDLKAKEVEENERTAHFRVPEWRLIVRKTERDWQQYLQTNHQVIRNT